MVLEQNNTMLYTFTLVSTCIWGFNENLKAYFMRPWCSGECSRGCEAHRIPATFAVVWEMVGAVLLLLVAEVVWCIYRGGLPVIAPAFWSAMVVTCVLNVLMENMLAVARQIEVPSVYVPLAATMPAWVIMAGWIINAQWPSFYARLGILVIAFSTYCIKLAGTPIEPPWVVKTFLPSALHSSATFFAAPWIRLFGLAGAEVKRINLGIVTVPVNGALLAVIVAWFGAIAVNFDWIAITASDPMIFSGVAFAVVGLSTFILSGRGSGWSIVRWPASGSNHFKRVFAGIGVIRGIINILACITAFYTIGPNMGALRRIFIVWTIIFSPLFEGKGELSDRFVFFVRLLAAIGMVVGCALVAF